MLEHRILSTIKFFDFQNLPLTGFEVFSYLISDNKFEQEVFKPDQLEEVLKNLDLLVAEEKLSEHYGYYFLPGKQSLVNDRLRGHLFGIIRERRIRRYVKFLKFIPFVRGVALSGSQALGLEKTDSDIDLLIITQPGFLWTARTLVTGFFQILGLRRHGSYIANRFCLNHYISGPKLLTDGQNLYTALEYAKLRPLVYEESIRGFQLVNKPWIQKYFANVFGQFPKSYDYRQSPVQRFLELALNNRFGLWLEARLSALELPRIRQEKYIVVRDDELSFHPHSKAESLIKQFNQEE